MAYSIECNNLQCQKPDWAANIVDLIENHCDDNGWLICKHCDNRTAYITKSFTLQEGDGATWEPVIRGIIRITSGIETYSPFVFLLSYGPAEPVIDFWFCYYKDTRKQPGGLLKLGYGPGGPPVLDAAQILEIVADMLRKGLISAKDICKIFDEDDPERRPTASVKV
jgi:hypothetical protein